MSRRQSLTEIADEVSQKVAAVRQHDDPPWRRVAGCFGISPAAARLFLRLIAFLSYTLNLTFGAWASP